MNIDIATYLKDKQNFIEEMYGDIFISVEVLGLSEGGYEKVINEIVFKQMRFLMQSLHNRHNEEAKNSVEIISKEVTADNKLLVKYNIELKVALNDVKDLNESKFYIINNPQIAAIRNLYAAEPECFKPNEEPTTDTHLDSLFYYYTPQTCTHRSSDWQEVNPELQVSYEEKINYPEYDLIWQDDTLNVFQIFSPASDMTEDDTGVYAYKRFLKLLRAELGAGEAILGSLDQAISDPLNNSEIELKYSLADGRELNVYTALWESEWKYEDDKIDLFVEKFKESDFISFNGHAGYGAEVREMNSFIKEEVNKFHLYYINSCWSYSHNENDSDSIDYIGNIRPSYFHLMADQDFAIIKGLWEKKSYQDILLAIDDRLNVVTSKEEHNPHVAITGEENNKYQPDKNQP